MNSRLPFFSHPLPYLFERCIICGCKRRSMSRAIVLRVYQQLSPLPGVVGSGEGVGPNGLLQLSLGSSFLQRHSWPFQHSLSQQCSPSSKHVYSGVGLLGVYLHKTVIACLYCNCVFSLSIVVGWIIAGGKFEAGWVVREKHAGGFLWATDLRSPHRVVARVPLHPVVAHSRQVGRRHRHRSWSCSILFHLEIFFNLLYFPLSTWKSLQRLSLQRQTVLLWHSPKMQCCPSSQNTPSSGVRETL